MAYVIGYLPKDICAELRKAKEGLQLLDKKIQQRIESYVRSGKSEAETNQLIADEFMALFNDQYGKYGELMEKARMLLKLSIEQTYYINFYTGEVRVQKYIN